MNKRRLVWIAFLSLAACSMEHAKRSTEQAKQKLEPAARAVQPAVSAVECGGGSVRDAIAACRAEGGKVGHCAIVAWHSGVSDATACYTYSTSIRKRREQLVGQEGQLDAQIRYLQDVNTDTQQLNAELGKRLEEVTARTDVAVDSLSRGEMTQEELAQLRAILDNEVSSAQHQLDTASHELQLAQQYRAQQPSTAALDAQIDRLQSLLNEAQRQTRGLVAQRQRI